MGAVPSSKKVHVDVEALPRLYPEPNYEIKTRSPMPENWSLNIMRGKKEDQIKNESYVIVRRKCYDYVQAFAQCEKENGLFWTVFNCQEEAQKMNLCFEHELYVELDKRRRDIKTHNEWWWRILYDENGEIQDQADWDGSWFLTMKLKEFLGIPWKKSQKSQKKEAQKSSQLY